MLSLHPLHPFSVSFSLKPMTYLLWPAIITDFYCASVENVLDCLPKCLSTSQRNFAASFAARASFQGGLNHSTSLFLGLCVKPDQRCIH